MKVFYGIALLGLCFVLLRNSSSGTKSILLGVPQPEEPAAHEIKFNDRVIAGALSVPVTLDNTDSAYVNQVRFGQSSQRYVVAGKECVRDVPVNVACDPRDPNLFPILVTWVSTTDNETVIRQWIQYYRKGADFPVIRFPKRPGKE